MNEYKIIYKLNNELNENKISGPNNVIINLLEELFHGEIILNEACVSIKNNSQINEINLINLLTFLENLIQKNIFFGIKDVISIVNAINNNQLPMLEELVYKNREAITILNSGKAIYPKSINQALYIKSLNKNDIIFAVGPAGTGKTYLAVLYAASLLKRQKVRKIVLVRPVVEAGEKLGFLPGDLKEKVDPYLVPLYDALNECFGRENAQKMQDNGTIEVAPLAYMRGRTLDNCAIILDEAQNTTTTQMKMFLTRLGFESKMIITGDITQIDLPNKNQSGLIEATKILKNINGLDIVKFDENDVMRNPLVYKIIKKYEEYNGN